MLRFSDFAEVGGLVTRGPNLDDLLGRAATDVDKIPRAQSRETFRSRL